MEQQQLFKVRDKRNKGWFYLDNEYLNGIGKHVGPIGIAVYVCLCRHADGEQKCFPSQDTISEEIGASTRSVREYLKKLEKLNIIQLKKVRTKSGKWLNNTYYLLDKTEWTYPSATSSDGKPQANNDTAIGKRFPNHRQLVPTNNTNKKNTNKNNTNTAKQEALREQRERVKDINDLIDKFKNVNPSYERLFNNPPQREAIKRMLKKMTVQKLGKIIDLLVKTNKAQYAPTITTPMQLESKLGQLLAFFQREKDKSSNNKILII